MRTKAFWTLVLGLVLILPAGALEGTVPVFDLEPNPIMLERIARRGIPFHKIGRRFALLGDEGGTFEAWAFPIKLFRGFRFSYYLENSTTPVRSEDIVRRISVTPEATVLTFVHQAFTVKAAFITAVREPGALVLLEVQSTRPLTIACGFLPLLQPMWPAGLGGQYAYWDAELRAYHITEATGRNHGLVGSPAARGISYTPAHMLSETPNEFQIVIPDPGKVKHRFIPIVMAGGKGNREQVEEVYDRLLGDPEAVYRECLVHFRNLRENTVRVHTPVLELDLALEWAKVTFDNLLVENPDLGTGLVAGWGASGASGRPGFGWFFGGDAYINTFSLLGLGAHTISRKALSFTRKWQRKDGKMAHELSQAAAYIDWWNDYHYGYIHGDTTPYYITAMEEYVRMTGDAAFIKESWESLKKAFAWCFSTDVNGDGLIDNRAAGLGALEYGALTGIETDIYLASVWTRAARAMKRLAGIVGDRQAADSAAARLEKARKAWRERFWDEKGGFYAYAFNAEGRTVRQISPWCAVGLMWNLGEEDRSLRSLETICSAVLTTDWGVRSISTQSPYFQPLNYNYGAVWPFLTGWVTAALYRHHMSLPAAALLRATAGLTFENALGCIPEVFSGTHHVWIGEAVPQQGFSSAGVALPLIRGLLGLDGDAVEKILVFSPHFPADWKLVTVEGYRVGKARFSLAYERADGHITVRITPDGAAGFRILFSPALGPGTRAGSLTVNGAPVDFTTREKAHVVLVDSMFRAGSDPLVVELAFDPAPEILPFFPRSRVGDADQGLKVISVDKKAAILEVKVEGLAGGSYELGVTHPEKIARVEGARLEGDTLRFTVPGGKPDAFVPHKLALHLK